jgi:predicted porin
MKKVLAIACVIALMVPAAAFAQSSVEGYGGDNNVVAGLQQGGGGDGGSGEASLPFTGGDLAVLAAAGSALLAFGFCLRRLTHRPSGA